MPATPRTPKAGAARRSKSELLLLGGGGHGVVVAEAAVLSGWGLAGVLDDRPDTPVAQEVEHLGGLTPEEVKRAIGNSRRPLRFIVAIGDVQARRRILAFPALSEATPGTVVHPWAFISPSARLGGGVFVGPGAIVHAGAVIGDHAIINTGAIIEHHCEVGENTHVAPGAVLAGASSAGNNVLVGVGARILPRVRVGDGATVAGGAAVIRDVPPGATVKGVPAA